MCKTGNCTYQGIARRAALSKRVPNLVHNISHSVQNKFIISNGSKSEFWMESDEDIYVGDLGVKEFILLNELGYIIKEVVNSRNEL